MAYVKKKRKPAGDPALETWAALNRVVARLPERECLRLIKVERAGRRRLQFVARLMSRLAKTRRARERKELGKVAAK